MATRTYVQHTVADGIAHVRLTRADKLNALTLQTLDELIATAQELRRDKTLRAVVLSGEGDSFCAGLDFGSAMKSPAGIVKAFVPLPWRGPTRSRRRAGRGAGYRCR
jgi:enoyl-CoA hydratase/carnithine racemase